MGIQVYPKDSVRFLRRTSRQGKGPDCPVSSEIRQFRVDMRGLGFRGLGFRGLGFRGLGFRV